MIITVRASDDNVLSFIEPEKLTGEILTWSPHQKSSSCFSKKKETKPVNILKNQTFLWLIEALCDLKASANKISLVVET